MDLGLNILLICHKAKPDQTNNLLAILWILVIDNLILSKQLLPQVIIP